MTQFIINFLVSETDKEWNKYVLNTLNDIEETVGASKGNSIGPLDTMIISKDKVTIKDQCSKYGVVLEFKRSEYPQYEKFLKKCLKYLKDNELDKTESSIKKDIKDEIKEGGEYTIKELARIFFNRTGIPNTKVNFNNFLKQFKSSFYPEDIND